jgi:hypothetical protein
MNRGRAQECQSRNADRYNEQIGSGQERADRQSQRDHRSPTTTTRERDTSKLVSSGTLTERLNDRQQEGTSNRKQQDDDTTKLSRTLVATVADTGTTTGVDFQEQSKQEQVRYNRRHEQHEMRAPTLLHPLSSHQTVDATRCAQ